MRLLRRPTDRHDTAYRLGVRTPTVAWRLSWRSAGPAGDDVSGVQRAHAGEEDGFGDTDLLELAEVQRLVGAVGPRVRVLGANESLHLGEFEKVCVAEAVFLARMGALHP